MQSKNYNDNMMHAEDIEMSNNDNRAKRVLSRVKAGLPKVVNRGKSARFLIPALTLAALTIFGFRYFSSKRATVESLSDDFAASLDDTAIEQGRVGAA